MKPELKDNIAIFRPAVDLEMENAKRVCTVLKANAITLKSLELKAVLLSLKGVRKIDESSLFMILDSLEDLQKGLEVEVGIIDYSPLRFEALKKKILKTQIALFKNFTVAYTFIHQKKHKRIEKIILYDENQMLREFVFGDLVAKGYKVEIIESRDKFDQMAGTHEQNTLFVSDTHLDLSASFIPSKIENGLVKYTLHSNVGHKFELYFNFIAHQKRLMEGYKLFVFDASDVESINLKATGQLISLSLQSVKTGARLVILGLREGLISKVVKAQMDRVGILFFKETQEIMKLAELKKLLKVQARSTGLTKKLVAALPVFIDAALETFESLTGAKAVKKSHKISACAIDSESRIVSSSLGFEGDINGSLILIFSEEIARSAAEMLLGEGDCPFEELQDAISEFANIIGGRAKALMADQDQQITIAIPKTFDSPESLSEFLGDKNGIQINLEMNGNPVILFLTY